MIKVIVIEDEPKARTGLIKMLNILNQNIEIIAESAFVKNGVELIDTLKPDIVFLDIELEDGNGFEILNMVKNQNFKVIFTTAYSQYAIKAFKYSAIDYLLKPIDPLTLQNTLKRTIEILKVDKEYRELLEVLKYNLKEKEQKIVIKTADKSHVFHTKDIIRLEADGAYTIFKTNNENVIVSKNLKHYQSLLGNDFIRCHQSHLVNTNYIKGLNKNNQLQLKNNDLITISTRKISEVNQLIRSL